MKLFEFYEKNSAIDRAAEFFKRQEEVEQTYNPEAWDAQKKQERFYKDNQMDNPDSVPVFDKPAKVPHDERWTALPDDKKHTSSGYRGLQNVKRRADHPKDEIDLTVKHEDPHSEPPLTKDEKAIIDDALRRLGL